MRIRNFLRAAQLGMILGCILCAVLFLAAIVGCATDPTTGKSHFDPATAQAVVQSAPAQAAASSLPYGLGALATAGLSLLFGYMAKKQGDAQTNLKDVATHAITTATQAAAGAIQADSGVTVTTTGSAGVVSVTPATAAPAAKAA